MMIQDYAAGEAFFAAARCLYKPTYHVRVGSTFGASIEGWEANRQGWIAVCIREANRAKAAGYRADWDKVIDRLEMMALDPTLDLD